MTAQPVTKYALQKERARAAAIRRHERIEDIEWLLETGTPHTEIPTRIGATPVALARQMRRAGRPDLAAIFDRVVAATRKHPCADCGTPVVHNATRCHPCSMPARTQRARNLYRAAS